jgi:hypothetical protein
MSNFRNFRFHNTFPYRSRMGGLRRVKLVLKLLQLFGKHGGLDKKSRQKVSTKSLDKKSRQKVAAKKLNKKAQQKVFDKKSRQKVSTKSRGKKA